MARQRANDYESTAGPFPNYSACILECIDFAIFFEKMENYILVLVANLNLRHSLKKANFHFL
jgi:hypothetical protein